MYQILILLLLIGVLVAKKEKVENFVRENKILLALIGAIVIWMILKGRLK